MRATRLISTLMLLQAKGKVTAQDLAERLDVSIRTVYRDVDTLQRAGIPIYGDAGPSGGYQLVAGYTTRLTGLTSGEAEALFLIGLPGPAAELGLGAAMTAARLKLHAALPLELRDHPGRLVERFHLDPGSWYREGERLPQLPELAGAIWDERRIHVRYRRWKAPSEVTRILDPHGLVLKAGTWYLVARGDGQLRTYRVSQIRELVVLEDRFAREADFDLGRYWETYLTAFSDRLYCGEATIRLSPLGRVRVRDVLDAAVAVVVETKSSPPDAGGWTTAVVPIESIDHAYAEFLKFGALLEVLAPEELRLRFVQTRGRSRRCTASRRSRVLSSLEVSDALTPTAPRTRPALPAAQAAPATGGSSPRVCSPETPSTPSRGRSRPPR